MPGLTCTYTWVPLCSIDMYICVDIMQLYMWAIHSSQFTTETLKCINTGDVLYSYTWAGSLQRKHYTGGVSPVLHLARHRIAPTLPLKRGFLPCMALQQYIYVAVHPCCCTYVCPMCSYISNGLPILSWCSIVLTLKIALMPQYHI